MRQATKSRDKKEQFIVQYAPLVKRIAHHLAARLPSSVQVDDLIQAGLIGLLDALDHYDEQLGAQFETYASQRIRGAMLDELRQGDWLPRSARKNMRRIEAANAVLEQRLGRPPGEQELADELKVPLAEFQQMLLDARGCQLLHYEDFQGSDDEEFLERHVATTQPGPLEIIQDEGFRAVLVEAIQSLPEREKLMMSLYYEEELNLKEIGAVLGVSESRVCQLHSQAIVRLRNRLKDWLASGG
ncbi:MAG: RNA polymerase sigma factor FliA [Pseudomonadota bacterium]